MEAILRVLSRIVLFKFTMAANFVTMTVGNYTMAGHHHKTRRGYPYDELCLPQIQWTSVYEMDRNVGIGAQLFKA